MFIDTSAALGLLLVDKKKSIEDYHFQNGDIMEQFKCAMCEQTFDKAWTDKEAKDELENTFGLISIEDCDVVCDDCYKKMGFT